MVDLASTTVVITGAASGIGFALANGFLDDGARVVAADIDAAGMGPLAARGALVMPTDVTIEAEVERLIAAAVETTGRLDVLFNNAGVGGGSPVASAPPGAFERSIAVMLFGPYYGMRAAIPVMKQQNFGRIINTLSRHAESAQIGANAYSAAKAGLWALERSAAHEVEQYDILINGLIPGHTQSAMTRSAKNFEDLQKPEAVYPTARMLATLPAGGPHGKVFWNLAEYPLFDPANPTYWRSGRGRPAGG